MERLGLTVVIKEGMVYAIICPQCNQVIECIDRYQGASIVTGEETIIFDHECDHEVIFVENLDLDLKEPDPEVYGDYGEFESGETDPKYQ